MRYIKHAYRNKKKIVIIEKKLIKEERWIRRMEK